MAKILVVDDDEQICTLVSRLLQMDSHEVDVATSGADALESLGSDVYDVVLLDIVMPGKGGIETIMEVRATQPDIPIIVMSGKISTEDASVSRLVSRFGAMTILAKPFSADELRESVRNAVA
jgi:DNA-binding response OmpR family regulator